MSRVVTVRVPSSRVVSGDVVVGAEWLTASFVLDATRPRVIERGGTLSGVDIAPDDDPMLRAARRACLDAGREPPPALRVRVVSHIAVAGNDGATVAASTAGALGARALLDLPLDDASIARIAAEVDGGERARAERVIAAHTVVTHQACDD